MSSSRMQCSNSILRIDTATAAFTLQIIEIHRGENKEVDIHETER